MWGRNHFSRWNVESYIAHRICIWQGGQREETSRGAGGFGRDGRDCTDRAENRI